MTETVAFDAFSRLPQSSPETIRANFLQAFKIYNSQGFTSVVDGGLGVMGFAAEYQRCYTELARTNSLPIRVWLQATLPFMDDWLHWGLYNGFGSDHLRFGGLKLFTDGSIQGFTAALLQDYHTRPGFRGELILSPGELDALVLRYHLRGIQIAVHTNGDAGIEAALCSFEKAYKAQPRKDLHHMLVHVQTASDTQLARMQAIGLIPTLFSRHIEVWGDRHYEIFLGPERTSRLDPAGSCVRLGMPFSLHVDTPVLPPTVLGSMHAAVNRVSDGGKLLGAEQRISPLEALKAYTSYAALCCGGEKDRGSIEVGRFGDFVWLSDDLEKVDPRTLRDVQVLMTVCGGEIVYKK